MFPAKCLALATFLAGSALSAGAQISSKDHPILAKYLKSHPTADKDRDGVLSFAEYREFLKTHPPKQSNGRPAGPISTVLATGELLISDFEENNFGRMKQWGWTIEGDAFARNLDQGTRLMRRRTLVHSGRYLLTSFAGSDSARGKVVSPEFPVEFKFVEFLLSGGEYPHKVCVNLIADGKVLRTITGRNTDEFELVGFDVSSLAGRKVRIEIVDAHAGIWARINIDRIVQTSKTKATRVVKSAPTDFGSVRGTVITTAGLFRGAVKTANGTLSAGKQTLKTADLLQAICENASTAPKTPAAIHLTDGQVWFGKILELKDGKVGIQSDLFGRRDVPIERVATLQLKPGKTGGKPGTLHRDTGLPIAGKIVWIRQKDIAVDSPLGVMPIPRPTIQRVVLNRMQQKGDAALDEVSLTDGHFLRGTLSMAADDLVLSHKELGSITLKWSQIRYLRRATKDVVWLDRLASKVTARTGPFSPPPLPKIEPSRDRRSFRTIRIRPKTVVEYGLPPAKGSRVLRGQLVPVPGSRAEILVRIKQDGKSLLERRLAGDSQPLALDLKLPAASALVIEVDFGEQIAFPCGIDARDLHILTR